MSQGTNTLPPINNGEVIQHQYYAAMKLSPGIFRWPIPFSLLTLAGCVGDMPNQNLPVSHPANPAAAESAYPPPTPYLMAQPSTAPAMTPEDDHSHDHSGNP